MEEEAQALLQQFFVSLRNKRLAAKALKKQKEAAENDQT